MEQNSIQFSQITSLISQIHAKTSSFLKNELKERGFPELVSSHGYILFQLSKHEKMTMSEITAAIHRDKSTTTALIKKLESEGYVQKKTCCNDSRVTWISLTEKSHAYTDAIQDISKALSDCCCAGLSDEEKQTIYTLLSRIADNFGD